MDKLEKALEYLQEKHYAEWCSHYGEPGYSDPEKGIIFANWNDIPKGLADWLKKCGYELEWNDEWVIDYDYNKAYRTEPDSYWWQSSFIYTEHGNLITPDDSVSDVIEACEFTPHHNISGKMLPRWITEEQLKEEGFEPFEEEKESGHFPGQTDSTKEVLDRVLKLEGVESVVFIYSEVSVFYSKWKAFVRYEESEG